MCSTRGDSTLAGLAPVALTAPASASGFDSTGLCVLQTSVVPRTVCAGRGSESDLIRARSSLPRDVLAPCVKQSGAGGRDAVCIHASLPALPAVQRPTALCRAAQMEREPVCSTTAPAVLSAVGRASEPRLSATRHPGCARRQTPLRRRLTISLRQRGGERREREDSGCFLWLCFSPRLPFPLFWSRSLRDRLLPETLSCLLACLLANSATALQWPHEAKRKKKKNRFERSVCVFFLFSFAVRFCCAVLCSVAMCVVTQRPLQR